MQTSFIGVYRPVNDRVGIFVYNLDGVSYKIVPHMQKCFRLGDIKVNLLNQKSDTDMYLNFMGAFHFFQYITLPTRYSNMFNSFLSDLIWLKYHKTFTGGVISLDFTEHCPCFLIMMSIERILNSDKTKVFFRLVTDMYTNIFKTKVDNFDLSFVRITDFNMYVNNFCKTLDKIYFVNFPLKVKYVSNNKLSKKWITTEIKQQLKTKSDYFRLYRLSIVTFDHNKAFNSEVTSKIR